MVFQKIVVHCLFGNLNTNHFKQITINNLLNSSLVIGLDLTATKQYKQKKIFMLVDTILTVWYATENSRLQACVESLQPAIYTIFVRFPTVINFQNYCLEGREINDMTLLSIIYKRKRTSIHRVYFKLENSYKRAISKYGVIAMDAL